MKQILIFTLVCFSMTVMAQKQQKHERIAEKLTAQWVEVCSLSADQESKLIVVLTAKVKEISEARELNGKGTEAFKAKRKEIAKRYNPQIKDIVGKENMQKMKEHKKQQKQAKTQE